MAPISPVNPVLFDKVATALTYAKLYPLIQRDFMGKLDCRAVHAPGNMLLTGTAGPLPLVGTVTHIVVQGGSSNFSEIKKVEYKAKVEAGDLDYITALST